MKGSVLKTILVLLLIGAVVFFGLKLVKHFTKREGFKSKCKDNNEDKHKDNDKYKDKCKDKDKDSYVKLSPEAKAAADAADAEVAAEKAEKKKRDAYAAANIVDNECLNDDMTPAENNLLNITCPSGDLPKISFFRNSKYAKPTSRDVNTLKDVTGSKEDIDSSEPSRKRYEIDANSDDMEPSYKN
jgi:FtsZ-interacting cell division protein ZipA